MVQAKRFKPTAIVSFFTETGNLVARSKGTEGNTIGGDIVDVTTDNDLSYDAGTFTITLTARNRWDKVVASNDLVLISLIRDGGQSSQESSVFVGLVDDVRKATSVTESGVSRQVTVSGRSMAKALINFEVGAVPETDMNTDSLGWIAGRVTFNGIPSSEIVKRVMNKLVFQYMNYTFSTGVNFKDFVTMKLSSRAGEQTANDQTFSNFQGSILSFIQQIIDDPWNQLYWEVYNGVPTLIERPTPFNEKEWKELPLHTITDEDVIQDSTGRSDVETYTLFSVQMATYFNALGSSQQTGVRPLWYAPYFKKYGLRRLNRFTNYVIYGNIDMESRLKTYQTDLFNWNIMNPDFYNGTIVVTGQNYYKIGDRLLYKSAEDGREIEYFIEGVSHQFVSFGYWLTTISVTRGLPNSGSGRFKAPWGKGSIYNGGALGVPTVTDGGGSSGGSGTSTGTSGVNYQFPLGNPTVEQQNVLTVAKSYLNIHTTYSFGGGRTLSDIQAGRFDCSSWIRQVFSQCGINLGPMTGTNTDTLAKDGAAIGSVVMLQPGDLVFWNTYKHNGHVGIYIGDGQAIACNTGEGVSLIDMNSNYWSSRLSATMRRVID